MSDLIDRAEALYALATIDTTRYCVPCKEVLKAIRDLPSVEPQIIRCRECKHNFGLSHGLEFNPDDIVCSYFDTDGMKADDFCSYAERRTDE